jgi:hypothetical protein
MTVLPGVVSDRIQASIDTFVVLAVAFEARDG